MRGGRSGSYFFVIDAFVASGIFVLTIIVVLNLSLAQRPSAQSYSYASDYLSFITTTELRDFESVVVQNFTANGNITDTRNTIAEQLLVFHNRSRDDLAQWLLNETADAIPQNVEINLTVTETNGVSYILYDTGLAGVEEKSTHLSVTHIAYALINDSALYGPVLLTVEAWS